MIFAGTNPFSVLALFRRDFPGIQLLLLLYTLALRAAGLSGKLENPKSVETAGYLYRIFAGTADTHGFWMVLSALSIWLQAILLNYLAVKHKLTERKSWFIAVAYIFLTSFWLESHFYGPIISALFFFLLSVSELFGTFRVANCRKEIFNAGFFLGIGCLFSPTLVWYLIPIYFGINAMRSFKLHEQLGFLVGFIVTGLLAWGGAFVFDDTEQFWSSLQLKIFGFPHLQWPLPLETLVSASLFGMLLIFVLLSTLRFLTKRGIQAQKYFGICYWFLVTGTILAIFAQPFIASHMLFLAVPLAIFVGIIIEEARNQQIAELVHFLLVIVLFFNHFFLSTL
jgi:hypothetical protein